MLRGLLSGTLGDLSPGERDALKIDAREVLGPVETAQASRQAALRQTLEARDAHRAAADEIDAETQMSETVLALQHDRPVDDATLDEALSTFSALSRRA